MNNRRDMAICKHAALFLELVGKNSACPGAFIYVGHDHRLLIGYTYASRYG